MKFGFGGILLLSVGLICSWLGLSHALCLYWMSCLNTVEVLPWSLF